MKQKLLDRWLTVDTRTLGVFRIYFGLVLLANLFERTAGFDLISFYSNEGVLPNHYALFRPLADGFWSPLLGFSSPGEVRVALAAIAVVYVLYTLGWQTKWMQVLALVAYESLNFRFLLIQHGGNVVVIIVLVWTLFLPIGTRYSLDSVLRSLRSKQELTVEALNAREWQAQIPKAHVGFAFFCLCFNFAAIYFFNAVHKSGPSWMNGQAVHYVLWQNRLATGLDGWVRMHEPFWFSPLATWGTLFVEWTMPVLILSPFFQRQLRTFAFVNNWGLHLGIAALSTLGPFSFAMMAFGVLLVQGEDFDWLARRFHRPRWMRTVRVDLNRPLHRIGARVLARMDLLQHLSFKKGERFEAVRADGKSATGLSAWAEVVRALPLGPLWAWPFRLLFVGDGIRGGLKLLGRWYLEREPHSPVPAEGVLHRNLRLAVQTALPAVVLVAVISQLLVENRSVPQALRPNSRPALLTGIIDYLQLRQGWSMFAPEIPMDDMKLVVDAVLADGSHLDLLTGEPPDFDAPLHGPWLMSQHWCEMHARMPGWPQHWRNFKDYLMRLPRLHGWGPQKQVVSLEVWEVWSKSPPPGSTTPYDITRKKLFDQNI